MEERVDRLPVELRAVEEELRERGEGRGIKGIGGRDARVGGEGIDRELEGREGFEGGAFHLKKALAEVHTRAQDGSPSHHDGTMFSTGTTKDQAENRSRVESASGKGS